MSDNYSLTLDDFDYSLPPALIAQMPLPQRSTSRLLAMQGTVLADRAFSDLPQLLQPGDLLVMNDTRVLHARLYGVKDSGGQIEVLVERLLDAHEVLAQVRASKPLRPGGKLLLEVKITVKVMAREGEFYRLRFDGDAFALIEQYGRLPLPPYIDRAAADADESRYQTVFSRPSTTGGSVAAPTAGLHFDDALLALIKALGIDIAYVTLHVGAGTFQPVRVNNLLEHRMHSERYTLPQTTVDAITATRARGGRIVAVGTTTMRTLESAAALTNAAGELKATSGDTDIFITPGFEFRVVDLLVTNFHLPKSTLLMLVSAFGGLDNIRAAYQHAIRHQYRFFSYGDAMLIYKSLS